MNESIGRGVRAGSIDPDTVRSRRTAGPGSSRESASMGSVYRRKVSVCTTCRSRLDTTTRRKGCENAGHSIERREQPIWWVKYFVGGRPQCVSSESHRKTDALDLLKDREGKVVNG